MAGLLDIFGTGGTQALGLLGGGDVESARNDAQAQALYALAGSLLSGGPTGMSIVKGLQQGQQAYKSAMRGELEDRMTQFQLQEFKRKKEEEEATKQRQRMIDAAVARAYQPGVVAQPAREIYGEDIMGQQVGEGMTPAIAAQPARLDLQSITPALMATREGRTTLSELAKTQEAMVPKIQALKEGEKLGYMQDGKFVEVASGAPKLPTAVEEYNFAVGQGYKGSFDQYQKEQKRAGATSITIPTGEERKASLFQQQMQAASNTIAGLGPIDLSNKTNQAAFKAAGGAGNIIVDPKIQQYRQAADQWSESYLRVKTGAAATPGEVELNNRTYFPVFGDDPATVNLKARMRKQAEQDMGIVAGRATVKGNKAVGDEVSLPDLVTIPSGVIVRKR